MCFSDTVVYIICADTSGSYFGFSWSVVSVFAKLRWESCMKMLSLLPAFINTMGIALFTACCHAVSCTWPANISPKALKSFGITKCFFPVWTEILGSLFLDGWLVLITKLHLSA